MRSISPQLGQPTEAMLPPSIQKAGQRPGPTGRRMLASMRPYWNSSRPWVFRRAEVQAPDRVLTPRITRRPRPSR